MMTYHGKDNTKLEFKRKRLDVHVSIPFNTNVGMIAPTCMVCSMKVGVMQEVVGHSHENARQYTRRILHLSICSHSNFNTMYHSCCPEGAHVNQLPQFAGMACFEVAHQK